MTVNTRPDLPGAELAAALAAQRELGEEYEPFLIDAFLERLDQAIDARLQAQLAAREPTALPMRSVSPAPADRSAVVLALCSIALGIGPTAIVATLHGVPSVAGMLILWGAIAAVNFAYALRGWLR